MKYYNLTDKGDLNFFIKDCLQAKKGAPDIFNYACITNGVSDILSIWENFNSDYTLWSCGYSIFLNKKTMATFDHYRKMKPKQLKRELS